MIQTTQYFTQMSKKLQAVSRNQKFVGLLDQSTRLKHYGKRSFGTFTGIVFFL